MPAHAAGRMVSGVLTLTRGHPMWRGSNVMSCHGGDPAFERSVSASSFSIAGTTGRVLRAIRTLLSIRTSPATMNLVEMAAKHGGIRKSGNVMARVYWHQIDVILVLFMKPRRMVMRAAMERETRAPCPPSLSRRAGRNGKAPDGL